MKLTVISLAKKIKQDNEMFEKATRAEKRVIVAQDCLDRINLGQIEPYSGRFCSLESYRESEKDYSNFNIKEVLNTVSKHICKSCAKGSLFMSYVGRVNKINYEDMSFPVHQNNITSSEHSKLLKIFSLRQLALIELVFEGRQFIDTDIKGGYLNFDREKVRNFRKPYHEDDNELLIAICNNIIKNKGTFKL